MASINLKWLYTDDTSANCFFRTTLNPPDMKIMLQITERCNLHCKHCFLSATETGSDLTYNDFREHFLHKLIGSNVKKVTLTGGEPFVNQDLLAIVHLLTDNAIHTCICTNASLITEEFLQLIDSRLVHFNVSLDGISYTSHGKFREIADNDSFLKVLDNINLVGSYDMLNGILITPNKLSSPAEYVQLCDFALAAKANYILMNPLSPFGRGKSAYNLVLDQSELESLRNCLIKHLQGKPEFSSLQTVFIRFPNKDNKPCSACHAGTIPYIFTNGDIAICPYAVFASENLDNDYLRSDFIVGNIFSSQSIDEQINQYKSSHRFCQQGTAENLGCAAIKVANNLPLSAQDIL